MWQHLAGVGIPDWQLIRQAYRLNWDTWLGHSINWLWGSQVPEYDTVAKKAIELLGGPADEVPSEAAVKELIEFSDKVKDKAVASNKFNFRWNGLLRYYDILMRYDTVKNVTKDTFSNRCKACGTWHSLRADWRKCYTCGVIRATEDCEVRHFSVLYNPLLQGVSDCIRAFRSLGVQNLRLRRLANLCLRQISRLLATQPMSTSLKKPKSQHSRALLLRPLRRPLSFGLCIMLLGNY